MGMSNYNPNLPIHVFRDGAPTLQFGYDRRYTTTHVDSTDERVGVVIIYKNKKIYVYTDEASNLFGNKSSDTCIGKLLCGIHQWNGMAMLNLDYMYTHHPFSIV